MKHFSLKEFECKCGCGLNNFSNVLAVILDDLRELCGFPFIIRSGCRCIPHNKKEGGKPRSDHLTGEGVDIKATNNFQRFMIIAHAIFAGITRIGLARSFIHLGIREGNPKERFWFYFK